MKLPEDNMHPCVPDGDDHRLPGLRTWTASFDWLFHHGWRTWR